MALAVVGVVTVAMPAAAARATERGSCVAAGRSLLPLSSRLLERLQLVHLRHIRPLLLGLVGHFALIQRFLFGKALVRGELCVCVHLAPYPFHFCLDLVNKTCTATLLTLGGTQYLQGLSFEGRVAEPRLSAPAATRDFDVDLSISHDFLLLSYNPLQAADKSLLVNGRVGHHHLPVSVHAT